MQASYLVRNSSQTAMPVPSAWAAVTPASKARPVMPGSIRRQFALEPAAAFDVA